MWGWSTPRLDSFIPGKRRHTHVTRGWVVPRNILNGCGKRRHTHVTRGWVVPRNILNGCGKRRHTHVTRGWVVPRNILNGCGKTSPPPEIDTRTVHSVASRYKNKLSRPTRFVCKGAITVFRLQPQLEFVYKYQIP